MFVHERADASDLESISSIEKEKDYKKKIDRARHAVFIVMFASLCVFIVMAVVAVSKEGFGKFVSDVASINPVYYISAIFVLFCGYLLRFPKWEEYIYKLKVNVDRKKNFLVYLSMYSMDITPGRWGRAVAAYTLNKISGVKFATTFPAVVADIFTDYLGFATISICAAFLLDRYVGFSVFIALLLLVPFFFLFNQKPFSYIKKRLGHIRALRSFFEVGELYFKNNKRLGKREYVYSMVFTVPSMLMNCIAFYLVILSFGVGISYTFLPTIVFIYSSALLFGMITGIPATLGVSDAAIAGYLVLFFPDKITIALALTITIFFRIVSVWFVEIFGSAALIYTLRYWRVDTK